jgi:hypothetical protein
VLNQYPGQQAPERTRHAQQLHHGCFARHLCVQPLCTHTANTARGHMTACGVARLLLMSSVMAAHCQDPVVCLLRTLQVECAYMMRMCWCLTVRPPGTCEGLPCSADFMMASSLSLWVAPQGSGAAGAISSCSWKGWRLMGVGAAAWCATLHTNLACFLCCQHPHVLVCCEVVASGWRKHPRHPGAATQPRTAHK